MLVLAILLVSVVPLHFHFHHFNHSDATHTIDFAAQAVNLQHSHFVDLHLSTDADAVEHHAEAKVFNPAPDGILKQLNNSHFIIVTLLFTFAFLITLVLPKTEKFRRRQFHSVPQYYYTSPPLRSPPA